MKKLKYVPTILMIILCVGILAIGVYAIQPTISTISGAIKVNASNTKVKIELLKDNVLIDTYDEVRSGIIWNNLDLAFDVSTATEENDVDEIKLTLRITNLSTDQNLGVYFHKGELPVEDGKEGTITEGIKKGYACADNIMLEAEVYDANNSTDKIADVEFTPYSYLAKNDDNTDHNTSFDVIEMDVWFTIYKLYYENKKSELFNYKLNIEPYVASISAEKLDAGSVGYDETGVSDYAWTPGTNFAGKLLKIDDDPSLTTIPCVAFGGNTTIEHVVVPSNITSFGTFYFEDEDWYTESAFMIGSLLSVSMCCDVTNSNLDIFSRNVKHIKLNGMNNISGYLCSNLSIKRICLPMSVTSIGAGAFSYCGSLKAVELPSSITSIGSAFGDCPINRVKYIKNGDNYTFANGVLNVKNQNAIDTHEWTNWSELIFSVDIASGVSSIAVSAFNDCTSLKSIQIPSSVTSIGKTAFYGCKLLKSVQMPSNLKSLGVQAFYACSSLVNIELPSGITTIESNAFGECFALKNIYFPSSVTTLSAKALQYCSSLETITIEAGSASRTFGCTLPDDYMLYVGDSETGTLCAEGTVLTMSTQKHVYKKVS